MTLKKGDTGSAVRDLQRRLNELGYNITVDSWFGDQTYQAVIDFQKKKGITAVGEVGPRTQLLLFDRQDQRTLQSNDLTSAAKLLGVSVAAVATIAQVESSGHGFDATGRPVILFERHQFYRQLISNGTPEAKANELAERMPNIVNQKRGGYIGGSGEFGRFASASQIDETSAIESCSWGMFQIMGYHWARLGYVDAQDFKLHMQESEGEQLQAFCKFILTDKKLHKAVMDSNWPVVAEIYNGPAYKENHYDVKLARAFEQFCVVYPLAEQQPAAQGESNA
jgi:Putative peptidoglycan-binding domain-containing protein